MTERTIVVLGGSLAGPTAAARARETDEKARIIILTREPRVAYAAAGLPYHLSGEVKRLGDLDRERADFFRNAYRVDVRTGTNVLALDPARRRLQLVQAGKEEWLDYSALIFAAGARTRAFEPALAGSNVNAFRTPEDLTALKGALKKKKRVAVIGGGLHGLAMVDGLVRAGAQVTLIERSESILPEFGPQATRVAHGALEKKVNVLTRTIVTGARTNKGRVTALELSDGALLETDFVLLATGSTPRTELLAQAGAHLAPDQTVYVNSRAETSLPGIYACGVCTSVPQLFSGTHVWSPQASVADKTAQVAGENAAGGAARLAPLAGSMIKRVLDVTVARTGLTEPQARARVGANYEMTTIHAPSHDPYFPGASDVLVQIFWDRSSGRLLGAEVAGRDGVDKRIDIAATALAGGLTVDELAAIDFAYAPPYGSQRDPMNVAATVAAAERAGRCVAITPERVLARQPELRLLDVRSLAEHRRGHIPGSVSAPLEDLRAQLKKLEPGDAVVTWCDSGRRGYLASRILRASGFADVANLEGGFNSWKLMGYPVSTGRKPPTRKAQK